MNNYVKNIYSWLSEQGYAPEFDHAGIYRITIDGIIVYIGKSKNMMWRLAEHYVAMKLPEGHKYIVMSEAKKKGHHVRFEKIYDAKSTLPSEIEEEIGEAEGRYIRQYMPPLNTQIPKESDWRKYDYNATAVVITLEEILREGAADGNDS